MTVADPKEIVRRALARGEAVPDARYAAEAIVTAEREVRSYRWTRLFFALIVISYPVVAVWRAKSLSVGLFHWTTGAWIATHSIYIFVNEFAQWRVRLSLEANRRLVS